MNVKTSTNSRKELIEKIITHSVSGEVYILTPGRVWKSLVLKHFNKIKRGELSVDELLVYLESSCGVKYGQKHHLVKYPVTEFIQYISKVTKQPIELKKGNERREISEDN